MRQLILLILALVPAAVTIGCGTASPVRITERPEVRELAGGGLPRLNYSLAVTPAVLQQVPLRPREGVYAASVAPDPLQIQESLVNTLRDLKVFKQVNKVDGNAATVPAAINLARGTQSDLILIPKVKQFNVTYEGRNGAHIPKLVIWSLLEWVSWFMADELYRVDMTCEFDFRNGKNGHFLYKQVRAVQTKKPVSDFQRGIKIWGIVRMPGSLNQKNYNKVGAVLGPHAFQDMQISFLRGVLPAFNRSGFRQKIGPGLPPEEPLPPDEPTPPEHIVVVPKRNIAYIFGVDNYDELTVSTLKHAKADAKAFKELLARSTSPEFKHDDLHLLENDRANLNAMKHTLDDAVASSKKKLGTVVFYFAGRGAVEESEAGEAVFYLLPQDADLVNLEGTALSLDRFASALRSVNAEQVIIILDCGFDPEGKGRSAPTGADFFGRMKYPSALYTRAGYSLLTAAGPGQPAYESSQLGGGLLTNALRRAATNRSALGSDNSLEMREAHGFSKTAVKADARNLGLKQEPHLLGTAAANILVGK